jgi:DNA-binding transcriptional MerR regulator
MTKSSGQTEGSARPVTRARLGAPRTLHTISDVSVELDVAQHVVRFWESKFPQVRPFKRGGRRYYRQEDVAILREIRSLLYEKGHTIKGAQTLLRRRDEHPDEHGGVDRENEAAASEAAQDLTREEWLQAELIVLQREAKARAASLATTRDEVEARCDLLLANGPPLTSAHGRYQDHT